MHCVLSLHKLKPNKNDHLYILVLAQWCNDNINQNHTKV